MNAKDIDAKYNRRMDRASKLLDEEKISMVAFEVMRDDYREARDNAFAWLAEERHAASLFA